MYNKLTDIILENSKTFRERRELSELLETSASQVNNVMLANLYRSAIEKSHVDFGSIPKSEGDITKYEGYKSMSECLGVLMDIDSRNTLKINEIYVVEASINNIINLREYFEKGFKLNKEFIKMQYNLLVASCVEAVSIIISSFVEFIKKVDKVEFKLINSKLYQGSLSIENLKSFNRSIQSGEYIGMLSYMIKGDSENLLGGGTALVTAAVIGGVIAAVMSLREMVFYMYYSRMKLSDYLKTQAMFLEINKQSLEANTNIPAKKKQDILKKQAEVIKKLNQWSDKIRVNSNLTTKEAKKNIENENRGWSLDTIKSQTSSSGLGDYSLL